MALRYNRSFLSLVIVISIVVLFFYSYSESSQTRSTQIDGTKSVWPEETTHATIQPVTPAKDSKINSAKDVLKLKKDPVLALLNDPLPRRDFANYSSYPPHNINDPSGYAYATFYCSRRAHAQDPFFAATQSIIWRILWSKWRSDHPIIVFVCPFTPEDHRVVFRGQGAIVMEVELVEQVVPSKDMPVARWLDQFSKIGFWKATDYKRIVYLDVDAFPVQNIDDVFELVEEQNCDTDLLSAEDRKVMEQAKDGKSLCRYVFGGVDPYGAGEINGGFLVFSPNIHMHEKLLREARKIDQYDITRMEQGLLHSKLAFGKDGPFPAQYLPSNYNVAPEHYAAHRDDESSVEDEFRVIHDKLWSDLSMASSPELRQMWDLDWMKLCRFYDGVVFEYARVNGRLKSDIEIYTDDLKNGEAADIAYREEELLLESQ